MKEIDFRYDLLPLKNKLYRLALRITLDTAEAEDVVEDTLLRLWNKRDELAQVDSLEAYATTVCRNLSIDRHEKGDAQNQSLDNVPEEAPSLDTRPDEQLDHADRMKWIGRLFNQLPEKQRSVMQLRDIEGLSYKEIAEALNITEEQVKTNLFRARQSIRKQYEKIENYGL